MNRNRTRLVFHLIPNAHLDPVWLWDWREGLNEGLITCRTILDLMDEFPELTFARGESAIYEHIEKTDPATFERIRKYVKAGRWDCVGGTYIQADTNLPATETFARHYLRGQRYFKAKFGRTARVAWLADTFGHAAGLPEIYAKAGIDSFAFTRSGKSLDHVESPLFWWEGPGGSRILSYHPMTGWYGSEREEMRPRLDGLLVRAEKLSLRSVGVFCGLGNHGGGPTRHQIEETRRWAAEHPDVEVRYNTMHGFFEALRKELGKAGLAKLPVFKGELNFCLRGCYTSVAKLKYAYRRTEAIVARAEATQTAISTLLPQAAKSDLRGAWDAILFNSFHDILPGSSIERAYDDQIAWLGGGIHAAQGAELASLNALAAKMDTSVPPVTGDMPTSVAALFFNPHPHEYRGYVELEACLDYRPIPRYSNNPEIYDKIPIQLLSAEGKVLGDQIVATEHHAMTSAVWRKRVVTPVTIPALGWHLLRYGWVEGAATPPAPAQPAAADGEQTIKSGLLSISAKVGEKALHIQRGGKALFGERGLSLALFEDPWGSWGGMEEEPESIGLVQCREVWRIADVRVLEKGPHRASLWVRFQGARSWAELEFLLYAGSGEVDIRARVLLSERSARLKLIMPVGDKAEFDVPGGSIKRDMRGELPGGRWVKVGDGKDTFVFASDALYGFDLYDGCLRANIARASRYADSSKFGPADHPWEPAVDCGELRFNARIGDGSRSATTLAAELERPPSVLLVPPHAGKLPRQGSLLSLSPANLGLVALKPAEDGKGLIVRVLEREGQKSKAVLVLGGQRLQLGSVGPRQLATWRVSKAAGGWKAKASDVAELT